MILDNEMRKQEKEKEKDKKKVEGDLNKRLYALELTRNLP